MSLPVTFFAGTAPVLSLVLLITPMSNNMASPQAAGSHKTGWVTTQLVPEKTLYKWGYRSRKPFYLHRLCQSHRVTARAVELQGLKALRAVSGTKLFPRYNLVKELFANEVLARQRIKEIKERRFANSRVSKGCLLRYSFRINNQVFSVHTDAAVFHSRAMKALFERWQQVLTRK